MSADLRAPRHRVVSRDAQTRHDEPEGPVRSVVRRVVARGASVVARPPRSRPHEVDGEEPRPRSVVAFAGGQAAGARSSRPSIVQRFERCRYVSARRAPGRVDLEQGARPGDRRVGGPLVADRDEPGDRQPVLAPGDLLRGAVDSQSVRTWTLTGATRIIAISLLLRRCCRRHRGHTGCERVFCSWAYSTEHLFDVKPSAPDPRRRV